jgi:hypothetical protein
MNDSLMTEALITAAQFLSRGLTSHRGGRCPYCSRQYVMVAGDPKSPTRDHIAPAWAGGKRRTICCKQCNHDKAHRFLSDWMELLRARKDPRVPFVQAAMARWPHLSHSDGCASPSDLPYSPRLHDYQGERPPDDTRRTDAEVLAVKLRGHRNNSWLPCPICLQYFPDETARSQHHDAKHVVAHRLA